MESNKIELRKFTEGSNLGKYSKLEPMHIYCAFIAQHIERSVDMKFVWKVYKDPCKNYIVNKITIWPNGGRVSFMELHETYDSLYYKSDLIIPLKLLKEVKKKECNADLTCEVKL